jgi:hypothetical protein
MERVHGLSTFILKSGRSAADGHAVSRSYRPAASPRPFAVLYVVGRLLRSDEVRIAVEAAKGLRLLAVSVVGLGGEAPEYNSSTLTKSTKLSIAAAVNSVICGSVTGALAGRTSTGGSRVWACNPASLNVCKDGSSAASTATPSRRGVSETTIVVFHLVASVSWRTPRATSRATEVRKTSSRIVASSPNARRMSNRVPVDGFPCQPGGPCCWSFRASSAKRIRSLGLRSRSASLSRACRNCLCI